MYLNKDIREGAATIYREAQVSAWHALRYRTVTISVIRMSDVDGFLHDKFRSPATAHTTTCAFKSYAVMCAARNGRNPMCMHESVELNISHQASRYPSYNLRA